MSLEENILLNELNISLLKRIAQTKEIGNAFLFTGPKGSGRHLLAKFFMKAVMCEQGNLCGKCKSCYLIEKGIHPDIVELSLQENKQSIGVEEVRAFCTEAYKKPTESKYKFLVIDESKLAKVENQNALLITLEEPPENTVFILFAETKERFLQTVVSRCTVITTDVIPNEETEKYLVSKGFDSETAKKAARLSNGIVGKALEIAENGLSDENVSEILRSFAMKSPFAAYEKFTSLSLKKREDIELVAKKLCGAARDLIVYKTTKNIENTVFYSDSEVIEKASNILSLEGLYKISEIAEETAIAARKNCNVSVLAINMFIKGWESFNG